MNRKNFHIIIFALVLTFITLACGLLADDPTPDESVLATATEAGIAPPTMPATETPREAVLPTSPPEVAGIPEITLGETYRSAKGGYLFDQIPDYSLEETDGYTMLMAPDADSQSGPSIFLMGGARNESFTLETLYDEQIQYFASGENVVLSDYWDVTVGEAPGRSIDLSGMTNEGQEMSGRVTIVLVAPNQMFLMGAS